MITPVSPLRTKAVEPVLDLVQKLSKNIVLFV